MRKATRKQRFRVWPLGENATNAGIGVAADYQFQIWGAVILAVATEAACALLLSEDLQHGFSWAA